MLDVSPGSKKVARASEECTNAALNIVDDIMRTGGAVRACALPFRRL